MSAPGVCIGLIDIANLFVSVADLAADSSLVKRIIGVVSQLVPSNILKMNHEAAAFACTTSRHGTHNPSVCSTFIRIDIFRHEKSLRLIFSTFMTLKKEESGS